MNAHLITLFLILPLGTTAQPSAFQVQKITRSFSDNSEWTIETSAGKGVLKRILTDGTEWSITISGRGTWRVKQSYEGDRTDWSISSSSEEIFFSVAFPKNLNEWRTGEEGKWIYLKTRFNNNFAEWALSESAGTWEAKTTLSGASEWKVTDNLQASAATKLSLVFISILPAIFR